MVNNLDRKLNDFLKKNKLIDAKVLTAAEAKTSKSGKSLEEVLLAEEAISEEKLTQAKADIFKLKKADLSQREISPEVLNTLSQKVAKNYQMVVFERKEGALKAGLVNPGNFQAREAIEFLATQQGLRPEFFAISLRDFQRVSRRYQGFKEEIGTALESAKVKFSEKEKVLENQGKKDLTAAIKSAPVAKIVSVIIKHALEGGASDIHIEPGRSGGRVRYRVDGILHSSLSLPPNLYNAVVSRIKVLANLKLDETRLPQDGRIRANVGDHQIDLRVSVLPTLDYEKVVMRVLDTSAGVPTLAELGFLDHHIEIIDRNIKKPFGLFLLTGPTGAGKTTTLYSVLNMLNAQDNNITTLEDPIEYYIEGVNQSQINPEIGYTFASGLRAILRQDPNIIMVGEIRDNETAELAIHAGLTGHLVFSTLHTNNAWGAVPRLLDMQVEPFLLSSTLNLVMAQRLVRKICPDCRKEVKISPKAEERVKGEIDRMPPDFAKKLKGKLKFYRGQGCSKCKNTGYIGRTVVSEVLEIDQRFKNLIAKDFSYQDALEQMNRQGYIRLAQDGILKAVQGVTTIEEIVRVSEEIREQQGEEAKPDKKPVSKPLS